MPVRRLYQPLERATLLLPSENALTDIALVYGASGRQPQDPRHAERIFFAAILELAFFPFEQ
jgi:hypothetical protein